MESSFTLLRVRGIPIGVNWSWLVIFGLVVWSLSQALFPNTYPGFSGTTYVFMAIVAAGLFFASVLLHELGHALRALREGMSIRGITLWMFGGVAHLAGSPPSPRAEFNVAILGPVVSLALGAGFLGGAWVGDQLGWPGTVQGVVDYLGRINLLVLGFNLIPALPLDGGRVLRSWLWRRQRSFIAATRSAARAGQAFGWMLVAIGILGLFSGPSGFGGLWFAIIGWFLIQAARAEAEQAIIRRALGDLRVRDLMQPVRDGTGDGDGRDTPPPVSSPSATRSGTVEADRPVYEAVGTLGEVEGGVAVLEGDRRVGVLYAADVSRALEEGLARPQEEQDVQKPGVAVWLVVGSIIAVAGAALYHPPYAVISPGTAIDAGGDIEIDGVPVDPLDGRYLVTTVSISRRSALRTVWAALGSEDEVVSVEELYPSGVDPAEYSRIQRQVFRESRQVAAAAAARAVGLPVTVTGSGARVIEVADGSPADGVLRDGDVIVAVEDEPIDTAAGLVDRVRSRPAGTKLDLVIERDDTRRSVTVTSRALADVAGGVGIGVLIDTRGLQVDLPFEVNFEERNVGGPSGGLAYGLAVADLLDDGDFARARSIAATGTIALDGKVGPVGGVEQKALAADGAGVDIFFVPAEEVDQAAGGGVTVRGVSDLGDALSFLRLDR